MPTQTILIRISNVKTIAMWIDICKWNILHSNWSGKCKCNAMKIELQVNRIALHLMLLFLSGEECRQHKLTLPCCDLPFNPAAAHHFSHHQIILVLDQWSTFDWVVLCCAIRCKEDKLLRISCDFVGAVHIYPDYNLNISLLLNPPGLGGKYELVFLDKDPRFFVVVATQPTHRGAHFVFVKLHPTLLLPLLLLLLLMLCSI